MADSPAEQAGRAARVDPEAAAGDSAGPAAATAPAVLVGATARAVPGEADVPVVTVADARVMPVGPVVGTAVGAVPTDLAAVADARVADPVTATAVATRVTVPIDRTEATATVAATGIAVIGAGATGTETIAGEIVGVATTADTAARAIATERRAAGRPGVATTVRATADGAATGVGRDRAADGAARAAVPAVPVATVRPEARQPGGRRTAPRVVRPGSNVPVTVRGVATTAAPRTATVAFPTVVCRIDDSLTRAVTAGAVTEGVATVGVVTVGAVTGTAAAMTADRSTAATDRRPRPVCRSAPTNPGCRRTWTPAVSPGG